MFKFRFLDQISATLSRKTKVLVSTVDHEARIRVKPGDLAKNTEVWVLLHGRATPGVYKGESFSGRHLVWCPVPCQLVAVSAIYYKNPLLILSTN